MEHALLMPSDLIHDIENPPLHSLRFLRLPHPRTGVPSLFLPRSKAASASSAGPSSAILEMQAVAPHSCRSWFLDDKQVIAGMSHGKLLTMTPMDPVFLLLPILQAAQPMDESAGNFRQSDDIFEEAASRLSDATGDCKIKSSDVLAFATLDCVPDALRRMCEVKELTESLSVYRFSIAVLLETLRTKIAHLSQPETFGTFPSLHRGLARDGLLDEDRVTLRQIGRVRASCEILSQYLPPDVANELIASYDFTALYAHMKALKDEDSRHEILPTVRSVAQERKNEKRKATSQLSKGVSKLTKANTAGMAKISTFFKKIAK